MTEKHGEMSCEIAASEKPDQYSGILLYKIFEIGTIAGPSVEAVRAQFQAICDMTDAGGMVRHGVIMLGYHNEAFSGDVLLVDGEILGEWSSDDEEWCHFTQIDDTEITLSAPSPWMLHDTIADWLKSRNGSADSTEASL
ncbi:hypothetical protein [Agrobacterium sp. AGB01]|uniref:hypothetical protein n=1 Tax=Agrobacterium sp. AGB01 TaxID=2769302 RepID=UPI001FEDDC42|nr:hypothetical protein [Agrobacterium sp. AGB01]